MPWLEAGFKSFLGAHRPKIELTSCQGLCARCAEYRALGKERPALRKERPALRTRRLALTARLLVQIRRFPRLKLKVR